MTRIPFLVLGTILALSAVGCSGASEGNSDAAAAELRKEMPEPKHEALPVDETANVLGKKGEEVKSGK